LRPRAEKADIEDFLATTALPVAWLSLLRTGFPADVAFPFEGAISTVRLGLAIVSSVLR